MHSSTIPHETGQDTTPTFSPSNILLHFPGLFSLIYSQLKPSYPLNLKSGSSWHKTSVSSVSFVCSSEDVMFCSFKSSSLKSSSSSVPASIATASSSKVTISVVLSTAPTCVSSEPSTSSWSFVSSDASAVVLVKTASSSEVVLLRVSLFSSTFSRAASTFESCSAMHSSTIPHETGQDTTPTFSPSNILLHFPGLFSLIYSQLKPSYPLNLKSGSSWQTLESSSLMVTFATTLEASSVNDESMVAKLLSSSTSVAVFSLDKSSDTFWLSRPSSSSNSFSNTPPTPSSNASNISSSKISAVSSSTVPCSRAVSNSLSISFSSCKSSFCSIAESSLLSSDTCSSAIASALFSVVVSSAEDTTTAFVCFCSAMHSSTMSQDTGQDESPTFTPWCFLSHLSGFFSLMYAQSKPSYPLYSKPGSSWHRIDSSISSPSSFCWDSSMTFSSLSSTAALPPLSTNSPSISILSSNASAISSSNFSAMPSSSVPSSSAISTSLSVSTSSCWSSFSSVANTASSSLSSSSTLSSVPVISSSWEVSKSFSSFPPLISFSTCSFAATSTTSSSSSSGIKASSSSAILTANSSSSTVSIPLAFFLSTFSSPLSSSSSSCTPSSSNTVVSLFVPCLLLSFNNCSISSSSNFNSSNSVTVSISSASSQRPQLRLQTSFTFNIFSPSSTPSLLSTTRTSE